MALQFVVNLILARLLIPADFGAIGILAIFIVVSQVLIDSGFSSALIQKKEPSQVDFSTIFFWNISFSLILYFILFLSAPAISHFFEIPVLSGVLRCIGLNLIISSIYGIQRIRLQKKLEFQKIAVSNLCSYTIGSVVAVILAYNNGGVWSLVAMQIIYGCMYILILWILTRWHPSLIFSIDTIKKLFGFGGYIMAAGLLQEICKNLQGVIIGKRFSATQMGYYSQAYKLDQITSYSIPQVIVQVMYPVYASIQDERNRLIEMLLMNIRVIAFIIFPMLALLIIIGDPLILKLYGKEWLQSAPYFKVLCVGGFFACLQNINFYAVAAVGKSKQLFFWSFYKWGFLLIALLIGMFFGMYGILWAMVLSNLNIYITNAFLASRHVGLRMSNQFCSLIPILASTALAFIVAYVMNKLLDNYIIPIIAFAFCYLSIAYMFKYKALSESIILLKRIINK